MCVVSRPIKRAYTAPSMMICTNLFARNACPRPSTAKAPLIATPIALLAAALQDVLAWLTRSAGMTGRFVEGVVGLAGVVGGLLLFTWTVGFVLRRWRMYARARLGRRRRASSASGQPQGSFLPLGLRYLATISTTATV